ncbi:MAG: hypothetical protein VX798_12030 [Bacteroidota bacterium]|nr:hypothetical protein [Bacteroidota bacterium]
MKSAQLTRNIINLGIPIGLLVILIIITQSSQMVGNDILDLSITIDLLFTVPLVYFLLIRKTKTPKTTIVPVLILGLLVGSYFLPKESQTYLELFKKWILPLIEISILTFVIFKVRKAVKHYNAKMDLTLDFYDALKNSSHEILPKNLASIFAMEVAVFYYGLINWKKRIVQDGEFTYHKKSGAPSLFMGLLMVAAIETVGLHFLLSKWSETVAWIMTALSIYCVFQLLGFAKSLSKRPIFMADKSLILRYGIMGETEIPFSIIDDVVLSTTDLKKDKSTLKLSPVGELEQHNVVINLKKENTLLGLYGIKKKYKTIGFYVDEPHDFIEKMEIALHQNS